MEKKKTKTIWPTTIGSRFSHDSSRSVHVTFEDNDYNNNSDHSNNGNDGGKKKEPFHCYIVKRVADRLCRGSRGSGVLFIGSFYSPFVVGFWNWRETVVFTARPAAGTTEIRLRTEIYD